jgi:hypothetical protein
MQLTIWERNGRQIVGFELCYGFDRSGQRCVRWTELDGFLFLRPSSDCGTPVMVEISDDQPPFDLLRQELAVRGRLLDDSVRMFLDSRLSRYQKINNSK